MRSPWRRAGTAWRPIATLLLLAVTAPAAEPRLFTPARSLTALETQAATPAAPPSVVRQSFQDLSGAEAIPPPAASPEGLTADDLFERLPDIPEDAAPRPSEQLPPVPGGAKLFAPAETPIPGAATDERDAPLTLCEVLQSVMLHYPLLQAVERERAIAAGRLTSAMGAFDTNVTGSGNALAPGTYENYRSDFGMQQLLPYGGINMFGGYRTGYGNFPTYNLQRLTADAGEFRGGLTMPLAKNRDIDRARATRAQAEIDVSLAEPAILRSRLDYMRAAARSYWNWTGSGERRKAADYLVDLAVERDVEIGLRVARGAVANIERIDNQQNIALRQAVVVQADRGVQQATIDLSMYYRDALGKPLLAGRARMRPAPAPVAPTPAMFEQSLTRALAARNFSGWRCSARNCSSNAASPRIRRFPASTRRSPAIRTRASARAACRGRSASTVRCSRHRSSSRCPRSVATPAAAWPRRSRSSCRSNGSSSSPRIRSGPKSRTPTPPSSEPMNFTARRSSGWTWHASWPVPSASSCGSAAATCFASRCASRPSSTPRSSRSRPARTTGVRRATCERPTRRLAPRAAASSIH